MITSENRRVQPLRHRYQGETDPSTYRKAPEVIREQGRVKKSIEIKHEELDLQRQQKEVWDE